MAYNFSIMLKCSAGTDVGIDPVARYGFYERKDGSEGGGLWFEQSNDKLELVDYDGMACLPMRVIEALRSAEIIVDSSFE